MILLTLLHLAIRGIRLGPSLPAFITPGILQFLVDTFDIKPIGSDLIIERTFEVQPKGVSSKVSVHLVSGLRTT